MSLTFIVQEATIRQTKTGKDYLQLKIGNQFVSFFGTPDGAVPVEQGQAIRCDIKQSGRFWNGSNLSIAGEGNEDMHESEFPEAGTETAPTPAGVPSSNAVFTQVVRTKSRTYYVDVKVAKTGSKFMTITEIGGKSLNSRVMIFDDSIDEVFDVIANAKGAMN
jgi:hypothetical protein